MSTLEIIVPCFNEENCILEFITEIENIQTQIPDYHIQLIFIDDGSSDNTLANIKNCKSLLKIRYVSFSRNFGKEAAMLAGLKMSNADYTVIMDVDLQDPPNLILTMLEEMKSGKYDCIAARRVTRNGEPAIRSVFAKIFYNAINKISSTEIVDGARDFRMMSPQVVKAVISLNEYNRFSKGLFQWVGFKTKWLEYKNIIRTKGETKWSFWKLFLYSIDGITAFSTVPLSIASIIGFIISVGSFIYMLYLIYIKTFVGIALSGYASTVVIILMLGGVQLLSIGILGQYLSKTYIEVKNRPKFIIREMSKDD